MKNVLAPLFSFVTLISVAQKGTNQCYKPWFPGITSCL